MPHFLKIRDQNGQGLWLWENGLVEGYWFLDKKFDLNYVHSNADSILKVLIPINFPKNIKPKTCPTSKNQQPDPNSMAYAQLSLTHEASIPITFKTPALEGNRGNTC